MNLQKNTKTLWQAQAKAHSILFIGHVKKLMVLRICPAEKKEI